MDLVQQLRNPPHDIMWTGRGGLMDRAANVIEILRTDMYDLVTIVRAVTRAYEDEMMPHEFSSLMKKLEATCLNLGVRNAKATQELS